MATLERACQAAGCKPLAAQQLFLMGEGLIVASQVSGPQAPLFEAARGMVAALA
ncbi:hypothetical protein D3C79_1104450 [compost metagenome]